MQVSRARKVGAEGTALLCDVGVEVSFNGGMGYSLGKWLTPAGFKGELDVILAFKEHTM